MSRILLSKLDIDVVVQAAVLGPLEASTWEPLVRDADDFGTRLRAANWEAAAAQGDARPAAYAFAPLPVAVTAVEGLKQIAFFRYQSADEAGALPRGLDVLLDRLRDRLVSMVDGYDGAPWGWTAEDLAARADRPAPAGVGAATAEDPAIAVLRDRWREAGMPLQFGKPERRLVRTLGDPRRIVAMAGHRPAGHSGFAPVTVTLCADDEAARLVFAERVRAWQGVVTSDDDAHAYRFGKEVVATRVMPFDDPSVSGLIMDGVARLGHPDAHWWNGAPPLAEPHGEVVATRVPLTDGAGGTHTDRRAIFARTPAERTALLAMIDDPALRDHLERISLRSKTILLLRGVFDISDLRSAQVRAEAGQPDLGEDIGHRLVLTAARATSGMGSVMVLDRLPRRPHAVQLETTVLRAGVIGDGPPRD